jgi:tape measure domain-containing protein
MPKSDLLIRLGTDLSQLGAGLNRAEKQLKQFGFKAEAIGQQLSTRVSLPIIAIGGAAVKTFAEFDRLEKGLAALGGSASAGQEAFKRLNAIVLDTRTTLDLKTAALGEQRLVGAGLAAAEAERTIKQLGIAATVSGSSIDDVGGVLRQFNQIIGKSKIEQEDLNTILDRMPALGAVIKEEFGTGTAEGIRATGISMEEFVSRLTDAIEQNEKFQNVQGGLAKSFESFANAVQVGIKPLGEAISKALNLEANLARLGDFVGKVSQGFADLNPNVQRFIVFSAAGAAAIGPLFLGLGAAAKSLPLLVSGFKLLAAPAGVVLKLLKPISATIGLIIPGGGIGSVVKFANAFSGLGKVIAVVTSPIGIAVGVMAALAIGFKRAYDRSEFFRSQLGRLGEVFSAVGGFIGGLVSKVLPDMGAAFKSVGGVFNAVFAVIGGVISGVIEGFLSLVEVVKNVASAISSFVSGDFKSALESAKNAFDLTLGGGAGRNVANAFVTTFKETLNGGLERVVASQAVRNFAGLIGGFTAEQDAILPQGIVAPEPVEAERNTFAAPAGDPVRNVPSAISALSDEVIQLTDEGSKKISAFFNEFVAAAANVEFLQGRLKGLTATPVSIGSIDQLERTRLVMQEIGEEIRDNLGTALEETDAKARFFGKGFDALAEKITLTKEAMQTAYDDGFLPTDEIVVQLQERLLQFQDAQDGVTTKFGEMASAIEVLRAVSGTAFDTVASAMARGESAVTAFGRAVVSAVRDAIAAEIKLAVATQVASALKSVPFPFNIALAAAAGAGASALFSSALNGLNIPALAAGGITTGPQLALIGEAGPEAVVPLDRLESMINMGGNNRQQAGGDVRFYISGDALEGVLRNSNYNRT